MRKEKGIDFVGRRFRPDRMIADEQGKCHSLNADDSRKLFVLMISSASTIRKSHDIDTKGRSTEWEKLGRPARRWVLGAFCQGIIFSKATCNQKIEMILKCFTENPTAK
jgi:hypothetical protein